LRQDSHGKAEWAALGADCPWGEDTDAVPTTSRPRPFFLLSSTEGTRRTAFSSLLSPQFFSVRRHSRARERLLCQPTLFTGFLQHHRAITMYHRPFRPPLLKRAIPLDSDQEDASDGKRARLTGVVCEPASIGPPPRTPLLNLQVPNYSVSGRAPKQEETFFNVLWRNQTTKKNKTWDGDGVLSLEGGFLTLKDTEGKKYSSAAIG